MEYREIKLAIKEEKVVCDNCKNYKKAKKECKLLQIKINNLMLAKDCEHFSPIGIAEEYVNIVHANKLKTIEEVAKEFNKSQLWVYKKCAENNLDKVGKGIIAANNKYRALLKKQRNKIKKKPVDKWHEYQLITLKEAAAKKGVSIDTIKRWIASKYIRTMVVENALGNQIKGVVNDERFKSMEKIK